MNFDRLNGWLTVVTNIAVVLGLLLVAYEIRQNEESISAEANLFRQTIGDSGAEAFRDLNSSIATDPEVADIWLRGNKGQLETELEQLRYEKITDIWILNWENIWFGWEVNREDTGNLILESVKLEAEGKPGLISAIRRRSQYRPNIEFYVELIKWAQEIETM